MKDTPEWRLGDWGQRKVRRLLEQAGFFVVPAYTIEDGGAPLLTRLLEKHALPDLQTFRDGQARWNEVKVKSEAVWYQKAGEHRHGVDLPCWKAYREVERLTGIPGDLTVLECRPKPCLLMASFARLARWLQIYEQPTESFPRGGAFWPRAAMLEWPVGVEIPEDLPIPRGTEHPWSRLVALTEQQLTLDDSDDDVT